MEDCNMLAADCIVICCCSQCLILQMLIFVLLKLPCKLIGKTKGYAKKKLNRRLGRIRRRKEEDKMIMRSSTGEGRRFQGRFHDEAEAEAAGIGIGIGMEIVKGLALGFGFDFGFGLAGSSSTGYGYGHVLSYRYQCCSSIEQAEKVLEELSLRGEFAFGSFWGRSVLQTTGIH